VVPVVPAEVSASVASPAPSAPSATRPLDRAAGAGAAPVVTTPQIQEASGTTMLDVGLVGFGILFIAAAVIAAGLVRRHARRIG
jgi:hypothetical protein